MTPPPAKPKIVCECLKVTESQLVKAIESRKVQNLKDIICYTSAGDGCTACHPLLAEYLERRKAAEAAHPHSHHHKPGAQNLQA